MQQARFRGKARVIGKRAQGIDGRVGEDAGDQTAAAIKDRDQQEAHRNGKHDLAQIADQVHTAAVEQVDDMPDAEGHAGNDDGGLHIVPCNGHEQQAPEDHLLQKSDAEHTHDPADRFRRGVMQRRAVPEVSRCQNDQRQIAEKPPRRDGGFTKPISLQQAVLPDKGKKSERL